MAQSYAMLTEANVLWQELVEQWVWSWSLAESPLPPALPVRQALASFPSDCSGEAWQPTVKWEENPKGTHLMSHEVTLSLFPRLWNVGSWSFCKNPRKLCQRCNHLWGPHSPWLTHLVHVCTHVMVSFVCLEQHSLAPRTLLRLLQALSFLSSLSFECEFHLLNYPPHCGSSVSPLRLKKECFIILKINFNFYCLRFVSFIQFDMYVMVEDYMFMEEQVPTGV